MLLMMRQFCHLMTYRPVEGLHLCTCLQVDDTVAEEVESLLADILGIVPVLKHGPCGEFIPYLGKVVYELVVLLSRHEVLGHLWYGDALQYVENEDRVVRCQRASSLGDEGRMRYIVLVSCFRERIYAVIDVFLNGVIDA